MADQKNSQDDYMPTAVGRKAKEASNKAPDGAPASPAPSAAAAKAAPVVETPASADSEQVEKKGGKRKLFGKKKDDADSIKGSINKSLGLSADGVKEVQERLNRLTNATTVAAAVAVAAVLFAGWTGWNSYSEAQKLKSTMHSVVVAAEEIPAGTTITSDMLSMKDIPENYLAADATSNMEQFLGERANVAIPANDQVTVKMVSGASNTTSVAAQLSDGEVGLTLPVSTTKDSTGVGGNIRQGDTVNVWLADEDGKVYEGLSHVRVVALDGKLSTATSSYKTVTLAVSPKEAATLTSVATSNKNMHFLLTLNPSSSSQEDGDEDSSEE